MSIPHITSLVIFLPLAGALPILAARDARAARWIALGTTVAAFLLSVALYAAFDASAELAGTPQLVDSFAWFPESADIKYFVGVDGLSLLLVMLATLLGPIVVLSSWNYIGRQRKGYYALLLVLQTGVTGVFCAFDVFLFYVFFELTLIPMYFIIGIWGGPRRIYAAVKFVLFTLTGSLLMLVGIFYLGYAAGDAANGGVFTTDWYKILAFDTPADLQAWLFPIFAIAFAVKVPIFPLHTWLPDAHVEAPTGGSVILAGTLLKMGTYGLARFCLPFFPNAAYDYALPFAILAVVGIIYGALVSRAQSDAKRLVAYSSISHLGFVVLGIFAFTTEAMQGAIIQMVNHGLSTGALFLHLGMLYERRHTREMDDFGGIARSVPVLAFFMIFSALASAGLPGLNGFVGEFMILLGAFRSDLIGHPALIAAATTGVILAAVYLLWMVYKTFFGPLDKEENRAMRDMTGREIALMVPLVALMLILGFAPNRFLQKSEPAAQFLLESIQAKRMATEDARNARGAARFFGYSSSASGSETAAGARPDDAPGTGFSDASN